MSGAGKHSEQRAAPFYCPYCADEDLRPHPQPQGAWLCGSCRRVFTVSFTGLNFGSKAETTVEVAG